MVLRGRAERLPREVPALLAVRAANQVGALAMAFLAVLAGPRTAPAALAAFGVAALASRWTGGALLARHAPRTLIVAGLAATGAAMLLLAAARGPAAIVGAAALVGLAFEIYEPATQEMLARTPDPAVRDRAYELLSALVVAAGAVAGLLAAVLLPLGVRWLMVMDAASCLVSAALAAALLPRTPPPEAEPARRRWRPPGTLLRLTLAGTAFAYGYMGVLMFLPALLLQCGAPGWLPGADLAGAALLAPLAVAAGRAPLAGPLAGRPHAVVLAAGTVLLGALTLALAAAPGAGWTAVAHLGWGAVAGTLLGRWQSVVADLAPEAERPRWFAVFGSSWGVAQPAVPAVAGLLGGGAVAAMATAGAALLAVPGLLAVAGCGAGVISGGTASAPAGPRRGRPVRGRPP
ncbi:MFS transporter [Actinomadura parmotrematis]|uniref:MFS transporter n=1 Tax=Actinomadura parmotrematis TaxID=2864039 RepID=A0ABS7G0C4_9ACTN|nr:MFS transporter [Actinomadura parmotrematis]MBW8485319.1 MFS transporter [Actinomadura parmotrematis]